MFMESWWFKDPLNSPLVEGLIVALVTVVYTVLGPTFNKNRAIN